MESRSRGFQNGSVGAGSQDGSIVGDGAAIVGRGKTFLYARLPQDERTRLIGREIQRAACFGRGVTDG